MTTDPRLVAALVRLCRDAGAHRVNVAEGSGMDDTMVVMRTTGMTAAARAAGASNTMMLIASRSTWTLCR
ncbi:MAG: DUF362 domain-containing protein [Bryobacteraceae bacterium]